MSLQPISSSPQQYDLNAQSNIQTILIHVARGEHMTGSQVLERAVLHALNSNDLGMAKEFLRQAGLQPPDVVARHEFGRHAVYHFEPSNDFWPRLAAFRQTLNSVPGQAEPIDVRPTQSNDQRLNLSSFIALLKGVRQLLSRGATAPATKSPALTTDAKTNVNRSRSVNTQSLAQPNTVAPTSGSPAQLTAQTLLTMSAEKLKAVPEANKKQLLISLGVDAKNLKKTKGDKLDTAILQIGQSLRTPGKNKLTLKLDKKYELKTTVGADGRLENFGLKKKKGLFGKIWDGIKTIAPIAGYILAPFTGGLSLIASAAIGAVDAVKNKNWLGAIASAAGAFVPGAGNLAGKAVGQIASTVQKVAFTAQGVFAGVRGRNPLSLVGAVAGGFGDVAGGIGNVSGKVLETTQRVQRWANLAMRGQSILKAANSGDFFGAATGALGTAAGLTKDSTLKRDLEKYADWANRANTAQWAIRTKNYSAAANSALSLAADVRQQASVKITGRDWLSEALRLTETGARLQGALRTKIPAQLGQAALLLGDTLGSLRSGSREAGGVDSPLSTGLYRTANILRFADTTMRAVKEGRTSDAAAFGLGLAAELTGDKRLEQAAQVGRSAAALVTAVRSKNIQFIRLAGESLMNETLLGRALVERDRKRMLDQVNEEQPGPAQRDFVQRAQTVALTVQRVAQAVDLSRKVLSGAPVNAEEIAAEARDLGVRLGIIRPSNSSPTATPPFVSSSTSSIAKPTLTSVTTPPFVATPSDGPILDAPPLLGRQLFEPQLLSSPTVPPLFSTTPSFIPARFVPPVDEVESELSPIQETSLTAELNLRRLQADQRFAETAQVSSTTSYSDEVAATGEMTGATEVMFAQTQQQLRAQPQAVAGQGKKVSKPSLVNSEVKIAGAIGNGQANNPSDVHEVKKLLNRLVTAGYLYPYEEPVTVAKKPEDETLDGFTLMLIRRFQQRQGLHEGPGTDLSKPENVVMQPSGKTLARMNEVVTQAEAAKKKAGTGKPPELWLSNGVGLGEENVPDDVAAVKKYLNRFIKSGYLPQYGAPLNVNGEEAGKLDGYTIMVIRAMQERLAISPERTGSTADQNVAMTPAGDTVKLINELLPFAEAAEGHIFPGKFDKAAFVDAYRKAFPGVPLKQEYEANLERLLGYMEQDTHLIDNRWMAYMFATMLRENRDPAKKYANTYDPVKEGYPTGRWYYKEVVTTSENGVVVVDAPYNKANKIGQNTYYFDGNGNELSAKEVKGKITTTAAQRAQATEAVKWYGFGRGYVQVTHWYNYQKISQGIGRANELLFNPDLALDPKISYDAMSYGMRKGVYTTKSLPEYIWGKKTDYYNARRVINGVDVASEIQTSAQIFEKILNDNAQIVRDEINGKH